MSTFKKDLGTRGENAACDLLISLGYKILTKNFRSKYGELDIVAIESDTLVFVEVKTRWSNKFGLPEEAVGKGKLKAIEKASAFYRLTHEQLPAAERIDVVAIDLDNFGNIHDKRLIRNASL